LGPFSHAKKASAMGYRAEAGFRGIKGLTADLLNIGSSRGLAPGLVVRCFRSMSIFDRVGLFARLTGFFPAKLIPLRFLSFLDRATVTQTITTTGS
jgi:hypothetical protein